MLPTPAKFHYIFNLRDLSRIWEGILHVAAPECQTQKDVIALWTNECTRVIADRFTNEQDCLWFQKVIGVGGKQSYLLCVHIILYAQHVASFVCMHSMYAFDS